MFYIDKLNVCTETLMNELKLNSFRENCENVRKLIAIDHVLN